jgi:Lar family restriction alleviation protein
MNDNPELKPCPFCGSEGERLTHESEEIEGAWTIWCRYCGAEGPLGDTAEKAAAEWNMRDGVAE